MRRVPSKEIQSATFIVWGGDFDPALITRRLGRRPNQAWRKGDRKSYRLRNGTVRYFESMHEWSGWKKWLGPKQAKRPLEWQLQHWAAILKPKAAVLRGLRDSGITLEINCCVIASDTSAARLPYGVLAKFGSWGVDVDLTWYALGHGDMQTNPRIEADLRKRASPARSSAHAPR